MINATEKILENLNNAQKQAVQNPLYSCTKIVAGAGTGKTKIISKRFAKLAFDLIDAEIENPVSRILVITFTDKAANEMKTRIINELAANNLPAQGEELWISTFHGFCSKILRKHSIEANLSSDFELADESALSEIYQNILKSLKYNEFSELIDIDKIAENLGLEKELLSVQNLKKLTAVAALDSIFEDIFKVIKKVKSLGLTPKEFLDKTLYSSEYFSKTLKTLPFIKTSREDFILGWDTHLKAYQDDFCKFEHKEAFDGLSAKGVILDKNGKSKPEAWEFAHGFPENTDKYGEIEIYLTKTIALIYAVYQKELEERNTADFDDLINKTILIMKNNPVICTYYQKHFRHLIIDEFQDTNGSQLELIKLLLDENQPNITFVGDRKQSIYGFRFAQMENLEVLHKFIEKKYGEKYPEIKLETNYRSTPHVLNAVNYTTVNSLNLDEQLTANPAPYEPFEAENKYVKNTEITDFENAQNLKEIEAKYIASEIQKLKTTENVFYKDFAVLVKSHSQAELIEEILTSYGIPAVKKTNKSFFTHPVVKNAICLLRLVKNPYDEIALVRILSANLTQSQIYKLKKDLDYNFDINIKTNDKKLNFCEKAIKLYENNFLENKDLKKIFSTLSSVLKEKQKLNLLQTFYKMEQNIPITSDLDKIETCKAEQNLRIFEKIISDFAQKKGYASVSGFLDYFDKIEEERDFELPSVTTFEIDAVQLLTIHASKGLEFPYIFVSNITDKLKKSDENIIFDLQYGEKPGFGLIVSKLNEKKSPKKLVYDEIWKKPRELNENIRLFYVAVSRAEKYLNIITFKPSSHNKPAYYTKDFPDFVLKEEINEGKICVEKQPVKTISFGRKPFHSNPLQTCLELKTPAENYKFSFSMLNTLNKCENRFLLKYKYKFPPLTVEKDGFETGSIVHKLIYNSFVYKRELSRQDVLKYLAPMQLDSAEEEKIVQHYDAFLSSNFAPTKVQNPQVEKSVSFNYVFAGKNIEFNGDIDLLVENSDKTFTIIDFKTNENIEFFKENYFKQLYIYKKACENEALIIKKAILLNTKTDGKSLEIPLEDENIIQTALENDIHAAVKYLENDYKLKENSGFECNVCDYKYLCRYGI